MSFSDKETYMSNADASARAADFLLPRVVRLRRMPDARGLTVAERILQALSLVPRHEWAEVFGRSEKQLMRYANGADIPLSVLSVIAAATGVSMDWVVTGQSGAAAERGSPPQDAARPSAKVGEEGEVAEGERRLIDVAEEERADRRGTKFILQTVRVRQATLPGFVAISRANAARLGEDADLAGHPQVVEHLAFSKEFLRSRIARRPDELLLVQASGDQVMPLVPDGALMTVDLMPEGVPRSGGTYLFRVADSLIARRVELRVDGTVVLLAGDGDGAPETMRRTEFDKLDLIGEVLFVLVPMVRLN
jgi:phage repressor protein C with HTH and peptisase S24 domain